MQTDSKKHENPTDANNVLSAGFISFREQKRFSKLISFATIYFQDPEWESGVYEMTKEFCRNEVKKLGIPDGWQMNASYESLKLWFFQNCR